MGEPSVMTLDQYVYSTREKIQITITDRENNGGE